MPGHLNLVVPQWQGGGQNTETYEGALFLRDAYLAGHDYAETPVSLAPCSPTRDGVVALDDILSQQHAVWDLLDERRPDTILTVGGGCDADLPPIAHLNARHEGDLTLLYLDAHGDINAPWESESGLFYGMPVRTLLGEGPREMLARIPRPLGPSQVVLAGSRDLDRSEWDFLWRNGISWLSVDQVEKGAEAVLGTIREKGHRHLYVHLDVDFLDPADFPNISVPVAGGVRCETLSRLLRALDEEFEIVGLGLLELSPKVRERQAIVRQVVELGLGLGA